MDKLKPCPFCGSDKLKIERKSFLVGWNGLDWRVEQHVFSVRCNKCHARGGTVGGKVIPHYQYFVSAEEKQKMPEWAVMDSYLKDKAADAWNRRVNDD